MPDISWMKLKRRQTTGNLKTVNQMQNEDPVTPTRTATSSSDGPSPSLRTYSQPSVPDSPAGGGISDGNLFYAYARRSDDLRSRYLLTFASASIANEWWLLVQAHFPDCSRPGPQLFSFKTEDLLSKAWKHPGFEHLKTKWMYISFSDTNSNAIGGATQGIIPVQDERGNMLGGSSTGANGQFQRARNEVRGVRSGIFRLEEHFEKMMAALERNTNSVNELMKDKETKDVDGTQNYDTSELSTHVGRMADMMQKNLEHVENLSRKQLENEEKLRSALEAMGKREPSNVVDMSQLSAHLDRIQNMMMRREEEGARSEKAAAPGIDMSSLTDRLDNIQGALEQNSALMKALLEGKSKPSDAQESESRVQVDLSPLMEHLDQVHSAIQHQSGHMQALVDIASSKNRPLQVEYPPMIHKLNAIHTTSEESVRHLEQLLEAQNATREAMEQNSGEIDITPLAESMDAMREAMEGQQSTTDLTPIVDHLQAIREATDSNTTQIANFLATQSLVPSTSNPEDEHNHKQQLTIQKSPNLPSLKTLTAHLSTLQSLTDQNTTSLSQHSAALQKSSQALSAAQATDREHLAATSSQLRELMASHREMTKVMRELAQAITAQNKGSCDHIVVPPPRKVGRKIVGFVYDGKEGGF